MKGKIIFLAAVASALLSGCCNKERTIDFPAVDAPNTTSAIFEKKFLYLLHKAIAVR